MKSRRNRADLSGHFVPEKYLAGLPRELQERRLVELAASREGRLGYAPLPTDIEAQARGLVKRSSYIVEAERRGLEHRGDYEDTARRALRYYGAPVTEKNVRTVAAELEKVFKKGLAAWQTGGHRPGASQSGWAYARVASVLVGGKAAHTADVRNVEKFPVEMQRGILGKVSTARRNRGELTSSVAANRAEIAQMLLTAPSDWRLQFESAVRQLRALGVDTSVRDPVERALLPLRLTAGGNLSNDRPSGGHAVPEAVRKEAMEGLRLSHANNYGAWDFIGIARAIQLATQSGVPDSTRSRMRNYFSRHRRDKEAGGWGSRTMPSRGYMAWLNWGGDAGKRWVG